MVSLSNHEGCAQPWVRTASWFDPARREASVPVLTMKRLPQSLTSELAQQAVDVVELGLGPFLLAGAATQLLKDLA